jgi:hypothetical protein
MDQGKALCSLFFLIDHHFNSLFPQFSFHQYLCTFNGILALQQYIGQYFEKNRFPTKSGERKVAAFNVMNKKYVGYLRIALFFHIVSGMTAQLGSSLSIFLEDYYPAFSRKLAYLAATAEVYLHAPTAFILTPFVYGDQGVIPYVYGVVSFLLLSSGLSALEEASESTSTPFKSNSKINSKINSKSKSIATKPKRRVEIRRMCTTISIFLYVRLYAIMRGAGGFLRKQKYSMAVMTAGTAMMPVGWNSSCFPAIFWLLMFLNRKTAGKTFDLINKFGVDGAAIRQEHLA